MEMASSLAKIIETTKQIAPSVEVKHDSSQWFGREVLLVTLTKPGRATEAFEVSLECAHDPPRLSKLLQEKIDELQGSRVQIITSTFENLDEQVPGY